MRVFTKEDLKTAINRNDRNQVQAILNDVDANGRPRVDINNLSENLGTALNHAICVWPDFANRRRNINREIFYDIINKRDNQGNVVVDINVPVAHGQSAFSFLLDDYIEPGLRFELLQALLDVRGRDGALVADLTRDGANIPLLK